MTTDKIIELVSIALNDADNAFWSKSTLLSLVQRAYNDLLRTTKAFHTTEKLNWDNDARELGFVRPSGIFEPTLVLWNSDTLERKTPAEMNSVNQYWNTYPHEDEALYWIPLSPSTYTIWPFPDVDGVITICGYSLDTTPLNHSPGQGETDEGPVALPTAIQYSIVDMAVESALKARYGSPGHLQASQVVLQDVAAGMSNVTEIVSGAGRRNA